MVEKISPIWWDFTDMILSYKVGQEGVQIKVKKNPIIIDFRKENDQNLQEKDAYGFVTNVDS